jgi:hypothetical protein
MRSTRLSTIFSKPDESTAGRDPGMLENPNCSRIQIKLLQKSHNTMPAVISATEMYVVSIKPTDQRAHLPRGLPFRLCARHERTCTHDERLMACAPGGNSGTMIFRSTRARSGSVDPCTRMLALHFASIGTWKLSASTLAAVGSRVEI